MKTNKSQRVEKNRAHKTNFENYQDMDKFVEAIQSKIKNSKPVKKTRVISFKINPLILIATVIIGGFLLFTFFNKGILANKVTLDKIIKGIENNEYSQILIQDDGKVVANGKSFIILNGSLDESGVKDKNLKRDVKTVELEELIDELEPKSVTERVRSLFTSDPVGVTEIIAGDNFIIGVKSASEESLLVEETSLSEFEKVLEDKNLDLNDITVEIKKLNVFGKQVNEDSFSERINSKQFVSIYNLDGIVIGQIKQNEVLQEYIDWTPSIYTFTDILQGEGISLKSENFEIVSVNVPAGISLDDVLTILTLIGFVILGFIIFRGAQSSGMGIMQFGQSKAKMFFGSKTNTTFKDVAGIDEAREELNEVVDFLRNPNKYRKLGARIPKGILMFGSPGTGKTLLARAIAGEAQVPFFHTSGSEFEEMLVGAGASRVRDLFAKAKKAAPSLIFIDEIDAVARKRGTRIQSGSTEQTLNQILVEMDGFETNTNVIVIAATNRPDVLDPAILRPGRFDRQIRIEVPDKEGRKQILEIHSKNKPFAKEVDLDKMAKRTVGFTGADLENILNEAAIMTAKDNRKEITNSDIEEAISKVMIGPAKKSRKRTEKELKLVAYHEAGHAVVAKYTPNATPVDKISIISRGSTGGVTMFLPKEDENIVSRGKLLADITVSLGGRAAEEIALDDITTGASNDIEKATRVARGIIKRFGMSKDLGLVLYGDYEHDDELGYSYGDSKNYSEKTAEKIDLEVREIINQAYESAKKVLIENRDKLDKLANLLLEKEIVDSEEFEKIFESETY